MSGKTICFPLFFRIESLLMRYTKKYLIISMAKNYMSQFVSNRKLLSFRGVVLANVDSFLICIVKASNIPIFFWHLDFLNIYSEFIRNIYTIPNRLCDIEFVQRIQSSVLYRKMVYFHNIIFIVHSIIDVIISSYLTSLHPNS